LKAFTFRLDQALRWRETQLRVRQSRVAAAAGHAGGIQAMIDSWRAEAALGAQQIARSPTGTALASYAGFIDKSRLRIRGLETKLADARRALAAEMGHLLEAHRNLRLLENLKRTEESRWHREFDRELAAFADEAFLYSQTSKIRSSKM
jgi:flagellar export protein FliJ